MGAQHQSALGNYIHHEASKSGYFVREHAEPYRKPEDVAFRTYALHAKKKGSEIARVKTQVLPGCCGILLLHNFSGEDVHVAILIDIIKRAAAKGSFGLVLFSLVSGHRDDDAVTEFRNPKTGRSVTVYGVATGATATVRTQLEDRD